MNSPKISVIVAIYNVEQYLPRCIDSLLAQTFSDFELLLIDDGSKDRCGKVCDNYAVSDQRIRVFHKKNGGVSSARNVGLDNARGEWVAFVDSDDWVDKAYLQNFTEQLMPDTELVLQSFWNNFENSGKETSAVLPTQEIHGNHRLVRWLEDSPQVHNGFLWHRLFRKDIIDRLHVRFTEGVSFAEDGWFFFQYLKDVQHFRLTSRQGYHYNIRKGSLTSTGRTTPIETHEMVLRGFVDSLLNFTVPAAHWAEHVNFVKRYAWRLAESWFLWRSIDGSYAADKPLKIMERLCKEYCMYDVRGVPLTLRLLIRVMQIKQKTMRLYMLRIALTVRKYEQKIKRHL